LLQRADTLLMNKTFASVRDELKQLGITIRKNVYDEYIVRIKGSLKGEGYFTTDLDDALATGKHMASQ
jgi:hypothetical protein